ncbi:MAG: TIGR02186 family protein [Desulfonauticus sp.]|nr:TIGR02186 family protein [Desulfonauticus sp.]
MMKKISTLLFILCIITFFWGVKNSWSFLHNPREIYINTTFNGADLYVSGEIKNKDSVIVTVIGSDKEEKFKLKGRVWGIFWMTVGHYRFEGAPSIYLMYLPKELSHISIKQFDQLNLGYKEIYNKVKISPAPKNKKELFNEFLKLKQKDRLYGIYKDKVEYSNINSEIKKYHTVIKLPSKILPGIYTIKVYEVSPDLRLVKVDRDNLNIKLTGFPAFISNMAYNHSLLYGILAVIIAILAGVFMGMVFKDRGGAH